LSLNIALPNFYSTAPPPPPSCGTSKWAERFNETVLLWAQQHRVITRCRPTKPAN
jgi:hypothetical protein